MAQRAEVVLSEEEREVLERWARRPTSAQALALRCRIVLAAAEGESSKQIAARFGCNRSTVGRWRGRFAERRRRRMVKLLRASLAGLSRHEQRELVEGLAVLNRALERG